LAKKNVHIIRGTVYWAKVLGDPVLNYNEDGREWTIDFTPDEKSTALLEEIGLGSKIRDDDWRKRQEAKYNKPYPKDERGDYIAVRQKEKRLDGSLNRRISVTDADGNPWPSDRLIGNGSIADLKFEHKDYGSGKLPGLYPQALRILDLKEYRRVEFAPLDKDDPFYEKGDKPARLPEGMEPDNNEEFPE